MPLGMTCRHQAGPECTPVDTSASFRRQANALGTLYTCTAFDTLVPFTVHMRLQFMFQVAQATNVTCKGPATTGKPSSKYATVHSIKSRQVATLCRCLKATNTVLPGETLCSVPWTSVLDVQAEIHGAAMTGMHC